MVLIVDYRRCDPNYSISDKSTYSGVRSEKSFQVSVLPSDWPLSCVWKIMINCQSLFHLKCYSVLIVSSVGIFIPCQRDVFVIRSHKRL